MRQIELKEIYGAADTLSERIAAATSLDELATLSHVLDQFHQHALTAVNEEVERLWELERTRRAIVARAA